MLAFESAAALRREKTEILEALYFAAEQGTGDIASLLGPRAKELFLLEDDDEIANAGVDAIPRGRRKMTAFTVACERGQLAAARALLDAGADPDARSLGAGWTPLHRACVSGHAKVVKWLLCPRKNVASPWKKTISKKIEPTGAGANIDLSLRRGATLAHTCAAAGHPKLLRLLSDQPPEGFGRRDLLSLANDDGDSPLHFAVMQGHLNVVRCLLDRKVPADKANKAGLAPLELAEKYERVAIAALIRSALDQSRPKKTIIEGDDKVVIGASSSLKQQKKKQKKKKKNDDDDDESRVKAMKRCATRRQALAFAWKFASDDTCRFLDLRESDLRLILGAVGAAAPRPEDDDVDVVVNDADAAPEAGTHQEVVAVDLASASSTAESLVRAAAHFDIELSESIIAPQRARALQKRLLECVRSPAEALVYIYDLNVSDWKKVTDFLELLGVPTETVPDQCRLSGVAFLDYVFYATDKNNDISATHCPSPVARARLRFHLLVIRYLTAFTNERTAVASGSGAAHVLSVQRTARSPASPSVLSREDDDPTGIVVYRPTQDFSSFQRAQEALQKEGDLPLSVEGGLPLSVNSARRPSSKPSKKKHARSLRYATEAPAPASPALPSQGSFFCNENYANEVDSILVQGIAEPLSPRSPPLFRPTPTSPGIFQKVLTHDDIDEEYRFI